MSTIGAITVNQCDGCDKVAVLSTEEDYGSFEAHWYDGNSVHFCPECRSKLENQAEIAEDERLTEDIRLAIKQSAAYQAGLDGGATNVERSH